MNKLLISLLSLTGVVGLSTGGYFLLKSNGENNSQKETNGQGNGEEEGAVAPKAPGGQSNSGSSSTGQSQQSPPQPPSKGS